MEAIVYQILLLTELFHAGMEMMDKALIHATDNFVKAGYPRDAESMLIVELDGTGNRSGRTNRKSR